LWKYKDLGAPNESSTPAVADGIVYEGSDDYNVYALNATTGALVWKYATLGPVNSSPRIANGVVYVASEDEHFYALDAQTGSLLWQYTMGSYSAPPIVTDGTIYLSANAIYEFALPNMPGPSPAPRIKMLHPTPGIH